MHGLREPGYRRRNAIGAIAGLLIGGFIIGETARAQAPQAGGPVAAPDGAAVYFIDLKDGDTVPSRLKINFGLRNMGVAPAGADWPDSGHHHLLINAELKAFDQPIPNDFNHLHFGAGQTEAEITLKPGTHTLQLVMGDRDHIPHSPPVMSQRIRVTVEESIVRKPAPRDARVYFIGLRNGATVSPALTLHFGLVNMGVAPEGVDIADTGHHHLLIDTPLPPLDQPIPKDLNHLHFDAGQTQTTLRLSPGRHRLQLLFADENHIPHDPPVMSEVIEVNVAQPRARR